MGYGIVHNGGYRGWIMMPGQIGGRSCRLSAISYQPETTTGVDYYLLKCQFIFTGRRFDPETSDATTQMYFYRARYYSPQLGRFISRDPIDYDGGMNLYEYVGGGAVDNSDPEGLWYWDPSKTRWYDWVAFPIGIMKSTYFGDRPGTKKKRSGISSSTIRYRGITRARALRRTGRDPLSRELKGERRLDLSDVGPSPIGGPEAGLYTNNKPTPKRKYPCPPEDPATALKMAAQVGPALPPKVQVAIASALGYGNAPQVLGSIGSDIWAAKSFIGTGLFYVGLTVAILATKPIWILVGVGVLVVGVILSVWDYFTPVSTAEKIIEESPGVKEGEKRKKETDDLIEDAPGLMGHSTTQPAGE